MSDSTQDSLGFVRQLWGNLGFKLPGMVAPTFDPNDLEKNIADLKAVEGWLRTNISMLQLTIQGLEMQQSTLSTVKSFSDTIRASGGQSASSGAFGSKPDSPSIGDALERAALWPLEVIQQVQEGVQKHLEEEADRAANAAAAKTKSAAPKAAPKAASKAAPRKTAASRTAKKPVR